MGPKESQITRRNLLGRVSVAAVVCSATGLSADEPTHDRITRIFDSHVHVWDLKQFHLPWLDNAIPVLRRDYSIADYRAAVAGLSVVSAAYIEVNVEPIQQEREAEYVTGLCRQPDNPIAVGVIAGDPRKPGFKKYIERFQDRTGIRGVRFLYPPGGAADREFIEGLQFLGERQLSFELQLGPGLLADAARTAEACPQTKFVLNHCGGASPRLFRADANTNASDRKLGQTWHRDISAIAKRDNIVCKISGIADTALPGDATTADVAPIVNFCLEQFGPDRVLFGGNWPVCLKGSTLKHWIESLNQVVGNRPEDERRKLFYENGTRVYRVGNLPKAGSER
jgi:predicted TIM-barrel fold metal-dependent hydrolase